MFPKGKMEEMLHKGKMVELGMVVKESNLEHWNLVSFGSAKGCAMAQMSTKDNDEDNNDFTRGLSSGEDWSL
jgi:hypothetical protein